MAPSEQFEPLPRGRHRLSSDEVRAAQRGRLLKAMTDVVAARGYPAATVADVLAGAGVSRQTFYENFRDKQDCFLAVLAESARLLEDRLAFDETGDEPVPERVQRLLDTYLTVMADNPDVARVFLVESYAAGPAAQAARVAVQERFAERVLGLLGAVPDRRGGADPAFTVRILTGGIASLVTAALVMAEPGRIRAAAPEMGRLVRDLISG